MDGKYVNIFSRKSDSIGGSSIEKQLFLLAYELEEDILKLIIVGSHENYYRNLTRYHNE